MRPIAFAEVSLVSLLFSRFLIRAGAYAIDDSCKPYEFDKRDKTQIIESAMSAAHNMAVNVANKTVRPETITYMDDTRALLFPKSTTDTWNLIQDKYRLLITNTPWTVTSYGSITRDILTIYCGDYNFAANPDAGPNVWTDLSTGTNVYSAIHNGDPNASLCPAGGLGETLDYLMVQNPINIQGEQEAHIIILCDGALTKGVSPEATTSQPSVSAINALGGTAGLYPGKVIDNIVYATCIASVLVHELMHVTQMKSFYRGSTEVYGWEGITAMSPAGALLNLDNYAYYATAADVPAQYLVINGQLL